MYCQECGHKQGSDQHFCRNCGMRLDALVESSGSGSQTLGIAPLTPREKGLRLAALFFVVGLALIPLTFLFRIIIWVITFSFGIVAFSLAIALSAYHLPR